MIQIPSVTLSDGTAFPELGFGTYNLRGAEGVASVISAIDNGYRLLDSAVNYENEAEIGEAVRSASVPREELLVATKIPGRDHGIAEAIGSIENSLRTLGLDYIDLELIHWPNPSVGKYVDTWRGMIEARERGLVRSIGVSNFTAEMIDELIETTGVAPVVNQVELHPYFPQAALRAFHAERGIRTESWSPLARRSELLTEQIIIELAAVYDASPTQVVLRWHTQLGSTPIPKSSDPDRQRENADVFGFTLADEHVEALTALERGRLWGGDPLTHEEM
ncbi:aldo/keto reductase [Microbacterium sp. C7(2022)]|uniref:aldo/keto reductase n=1 Tax=Microbacterium sp. C7(2022) TaxID=2992759 RepID=UPI00237BEE4C|nr:aldo/keto reductase [Microbacterium sp. C7(2022)]MDE0546212.1 aldo/keto reductase [Microbacterium sp. C7(2022)]